MIPIAIGTSRGHYASRLVWGGIDNVGFDVDAVFITLYTPEVPSRGQCADMWFCELNCKLGGWWIGIVTPSFVGRRGEDKKKSLLSQPFCIFRALYKKAIDCDRRKINYRLQKNAT